MISPAPAPPSVGRPAENISRTFVGTAAWNIAGRGAFLVSGFIGTVILARTLSPSVYGLFAILTVLNSYAVVVCDLGLSSGLLRFAVRGEDDRRRWQLFRFALMVQVAVTLVLIALALLGRSALQKVYRVEFGPTLTLVVVLALATVVRNGLQNLRIAAGRGSAIVAANLSFAVIWVGGLLALAAFGMTITAVLVLQVVAVAAAVLWLGSQLRHWIARRTEALSAPDRTEMVTYSLAFVARGLITAIVQKQSEVFFLGHYLTLAAVGYYDVGYSFSFFALMAVQQALYPVAVATLTRAAEGGVARLRRAIRVYYQVIFVHVVPIATIGAVFGDRIVTALYGAHMRPGGPIAQLFFVIGLLPFLLGGVAVGMLALGRPWAGMHLSIATAALNLGLDAVLIPRLGVRGAVIAVATTGILSGIAFLRFYRRYLGSGLVPWGYLGRCVLAASPVLLLIPSRPWIHGVGPLVLVLLLSGALFLVGARVFGLVGADERRILEASGYPIVRRLGQLLGS
jgi:O-antigen/teichoic acid export membrane protein